jgi:hypothetical protein
MPSCPVGSRGLWQRTWQRSESWDIVVDFPRRSYALRTHAVAAGPLCARQIVEASGDGLCSRLVGIPALAAADAVRATTAEWERIDATQTTPTPIYWIGDRVVYVTWDHGKCGIHALIANVERGRRDCTPIIAAIGS